ncbi:hypothetical protein T11_3473 [Trichinella zimbabwensis]|uniref:Uncharacterized protein n=1 Tax=Trichinella zimbabwensis TaxID=268475 RepID=A0A0V1HPL0_9BILA|nr:hypothetical protein T11_3473 [Trichinella zimbabwensis]
MIYTIATEIVRKAILYKHRSRSYMDYIIRQYCSKEIQVRIQQFFNLHSFQLFIFQFVLRQKLYEIT